jgi:hypothetical protein
VCKFVHTFGSCDTGDGARLQADIHEDGALSKGGMMVMVMLIMLVMVMMIIMVKVIEMESLFQYGDSDDDGEHFHDSTSVVTRHPPSLSFIHL